MANLVSENKLPHQKASLPAFFWCGNEKRSLYQEFLFNFVSKNTRKAYYKDLMDFNLFLKDILKLEDDIKVNKKVIIAYREFLRENGGVEGRELSKSTINRKVSALYSYYEFLKEKKLIDDNPVKYVDRFKYQNKIKTNHMDWELVKKYFDYPINPHKGSELLERIVIRTLFTFGMRNHEVSSLKFENITVKDEKYHFEYKAKGDKHMLKEIPADFIDELGLWLEWCKQRDFSMLESDFIFRLTKGPNRGMGQLSATAINNMMKSMCKKVGAKGHYTSHTGRVNVIEKVEELRGLYAAREYVGHSNVSVTERYRDSGPKKSGGISGEIL